MQNKRSQQKKIFSIMSRFPIGVRLVIRRKLFTCWSCDLTRCKRPSLSGSTSSCMLCRILGARSITLAFFAVKSAMAKRKYLQGKRWRGKSQKGQLRSERSISIQGGRRAKITYHTHATVVRHELKIFVIPNTGSKQRFEHDQTRKTSLQETEGSEKGKHGRLEPRL